MKSRLDFHAWLQSKLPGIPLYFRKPEKLTYPCVMYKRHRYDTTNAGGIVYNAKTVYQLTYMTTDASDTNASTLVQDVMFDHRRNFTNEGVEHDVFEVTY